MTMSSNKEADNKPDPMAEDDSKLDLLLEKYKDYILGSQNVYFTGSKLALDKKETKAAINAYTTNKIIEARVEGAFLGSVEGRRLELDNLANDISRELYLERHLKLQTITYPGPTEFYKDIAEGHAYFNFTGRIAELRKTL